MFAPSSRRRSHIHHKSTSSGVTGWRPTLVLVDAAPNFHKSGPMPSMRPFRGDRRETGAPGRAERPSKWWAVSLGTLPAGTTEAQVDDMMMVIEVADEAPPPPQPGLDWT